MPAEETLRGQRLLVVLRRIEHHLDDALDVPVSRLQTADVDSEPTRDRRTNLVGIQLLAFDLAALEHVLSQREENGFFPDFEAEGLHLSDHPSLQMPGCGQGRGQSPVSPTELWPLRKLMNIGGHSPHILR